MLVFGTEMHIVTFLFVIIEIAMFFYQGVYYLFRPQDRPRLWYTILLFLLIAYNITGGLFPDDDIDLPIKVQNIIAYGTGFLVACYFPYYFYQGFGLAKLRFHALYGVPLFLITPYLVFFVFGYWFDENLDDAIRFGTIIPFIYALVVFTAILRAIYIKYRVDGRHRDVMEMFAVYCAVAPWLSMPILAYIQVSQLIEVLFTNTGFIIITIIFIRRSIASARREGKLLLEVALISCDEKLIETNGKKFGLTAKEIEVVRLICQRLKYREIADRLFISPRTVDKHAENIFNKTSVNNREELIKMMGYNHI